MSEIADMVLAGQLCNVCGCHIDEEAEGFPRTCEQCFFDEPDEDYNLTEESVEPDDKDFMSSEDLNTEVNWESPE